MIGDWRCCWMILSSSKPALEQLARKQQAEAFGAGLCHRVYYIRLDMHHRA